jgi:hypothetical protein
MSYVNNDSLQTDTDEGLPKTGLTTRQVTAPTRTSSYSKFQTRQRGRYNITVTV